MTATDSITLKVSSARWSRLYSDIVRLLLAGYDTAGNPSQDKYNQVVLSSLGSATHLAAGAAAELAAAGVVTIESITTGVVRSEEEDNRSRGATQLVIKMNRLKSWASDKDQVLAKALERRTTPRPPK